MGVPGILVHGKKPTSNQMYTSYPLLRFCIELKNYKYFCYVLFRQFFNEKIFFPGAS